MKKLTRGLRELRRSLYNLYYYFNVIWNDRDWDHAYMWNLQLKKFEKAYKFRQSKWCAKYVGQGKVDQALRICIVILKRLTYIEGYQHNCLDGTTHEKLNERDWKVYNKLIEKYQQRWWD